MITFDHVSKVYGEKGEGVKALDEVNIHVEEGEIYGVIGFSGAGKSSLIRCVNLLEQPTSGTVTVNGQNLQELSAKELREAKRNIGMIFQHFNLLNSKTVFTNVAMPLLLSKTPKKEVERRVHELLDFVGLRDKADSYPDQLSGGQKQRVGIARSLATQPSILLCDEATSALDPDTTNAILKLLKRINQEYNITILIITHEMGVIREICDKVAVLEDGKVVEAGSVFDVFSQPKTTTAHNFVSTVMHDQIPDSVYELIQKQDTHKQIYRIVFVGESTGTPLLSQISKQYQVEVNVLFGSITELQGTPFGNLIVQFEGEEKEINRVIMHIHQQKVSIKEVLADVG